MPNGEKTHLLTEANLLKPLKPPVYKRQRFLLTFIQQLRDSVSATDLQKLVFLYSMHEKPVHYSFVPYKFGAFSFQLAQDIQVLENYGFLSTADKKINLMGYLRTSPIEIAGVEKLRGTPLIKKAYSEYPYYAINSEIAENLLSRYEMKKIYDVRGELTQAEQVLFTIGYEGETVESFVNTLIKNNVSVLCDIRKNPISRKFGFSQSKLKHIVETTGIQYIHIPELGIESEKRKSLETTSDYDDLFADYRKTLPERKSALQAVYNILVSNNRIALMCYEKDPMFCHRKQVENYLVDQYGVKSEDL